MITPTLQKPEGFRVKASEGEVVVLYFEPSATQNLKSSGFPEGGTTWQNRHNPSNSPIEVSENLSFFYDIGNNYRPLSNLCNVVYATKGIIKFNYSGCPYNSSPLMGDPPFKVPNQAGACNYGHTNSTDGDG